jgi:gliding motility-associated-like protein
LYVPTGLQAGTYSVSAFDGSCKYGTTFTVTPYVFKFSVAPASATVCQGNNYTATVNLQNNVVGTPCSTIGVGPSCPNPDQVQVGNGTGANTQYAFPTPYSKYYYDYHQQILYRATDLQAAGVKQGYLTSMAFNVTALNGVGNITNYTIKIKCTSATSITGFDNSGLSQVFNAPSITPAVGWNQHTFQTPYYWDGVSNILVDICQGNQTWQFINASVAMSAPGYNCFIWGAQTSSFGSSCGTTINYGIYANRSNTKWGNCPVTVPSMFTYTWNPSTFLSSTTGSTSVVTPTTAPGTVNSLTYSVTLTPTAVNCPVTQNFTAVVVNPVTPTITPIPNFCNNSTPVTITVTPTGGTFTTGIAGNPIGAQSGIITPSLAAIGTNTFTYAVGVGSCVSTGSASFQVSQFNTAAFSSSIAPMCVTSPVVNLNSVVQTTTGGTWSGQNVSGTYSFTPLGLATNTYALYYNTVSTPNATVCPDTNTMVVSVLNPPTPAITPVSPMCNTANTVQVVVSPNTGTWTPVAFQSTTGVFNPSLAAIGNNTVQYVIGTFTCNTQATATINVEAFVPATITGSVSDLCNTSPAVNLMPVTLNNLGTWSGPGTNGFLFDPSISGTGHITIQYNTNSSPIGLCPDQATLAVDVYSLALPSITQIGPFCNMNGNVQIPVTPLGGLFSNVFPNVVTTGGIFSPTSAQIGPNVVNYSITSGPCVATAQTTINVEAFVSADFSKYAGPFCKNDPVFNMNSIAINAGGVWSGPGLSGSLFTPANANVGNNNILTYYTHSSPTASLCPDTSAIRIQVNDIPSVNIVGNAEKGCAPVEVIFNTPSTNSGTGSWNFGDGSEVVSGLTVTHLFANPGSYTVTFNYEDEIGCSTQTTLANPVQVWEVPHASFTYNPDEITMSNPTVQFSNHSTILGNNTYQWQIHNLYQLNDVNPVVTFPQAGDYNIILSATTINGCKDEVSKVITVKNDYGVYIPSSFTPNFDGLNDVFIPVFSPYGLDLKVYDLEIFDRWGHSLFHTKDYTVGWDGFAKGTDDPIKQDVYVYKIKYKDMDGKIHNKTGHVSLLK